MLSVQADLRLVLIWNPEVDFSERTCPKFLLQGLILALFKGVLGSFTKLRKATISFVISVLSVCSSAFNSSALTGQIFM